MPSDDTPTTKVGRLIEQVDLTGVGADLEARWTGDGVERESLRDLADRFNRELLRARLRDSDADVTELDLDRAYRLLTDDDATAGKRAEIRATLEQMGVDVTALTDDFVTYQAIRSYLQNVRGASYEGTSDTEQVEKERDQVGRLASRTEAVSREKLERLRNTDRIELGTFRVFVDVDVFCEDCGRQFAVGELLDRGGCDC